MQSTKKVIWRALHWMNWYKCILSFHFIFYSLFNGLNFINHETWRKIFKCTFKVILWDNVTFWQQEWGFLDISMIKATNEWNKFKLFWVTVEIHEILNSFWQHLVTTMGQILKFSANFWKLIFYRWKSFIQLIFSWFYQSRPENQNLPLQIDNFSHKLFHRNSL